MYNLHC